MSPIRLVLASASPRRAALLRAAGFEFDTLVVEVDERARPGEAPTTYVRRLAAEKSAAAFAALKGYATSDTIVLAADTAVVVDGEILGKPHDDEEAVAMLRKLSDRRHEVMTGVSLRTLTHELGRVETTDVWVAPLTAGDIAWYVASGEGRDKAGAYAIQGLGSRFISRIDGSYSNVVGLPVAAVHELLRELLKDLRVDYS